MSNLTVVIDDDLLRAARIKALQQGTSVNEICREAITRFAAPVHDQAEWMRDWRALGQQIQAGYRVEGAPQPEPMWPSREAMYDDVMAERMPTLWAKLSADEAARVAQEQTAADTATTDSQGKPSPKR
jgi:hypothetical protein